MNTMNTEYRVLAANVRRALVGGSTNSTRAGALINRVMNFSHRHPVHGRQLQNAIKPLIAYQMLLDLLKMVQRAVNTPRVSAQTLRVATNRLKNAETYLKHAQPVLRNSPNAFHTRIRDLFLAVSKKRRNLLRIH